MYFSNEPVFAVGPQWKNSILYFVLVNIGVGIGIDHLDHDTWAYHTCYLTLMIWNLVTIYLVILNPGMAPRDPSIHSETYI